MIQIFSQFYTTLLKNDFCKKITTEWISDKTLSDYAISVGRQSIENSHVDT